MLRDVVSGGWVRPQLPQQTEQVELDPVLGDLAADHAVLLSRPGQAPGVRVCAGAT